MSDSKIIIPFLEYVYDSGNLLPAHSGISSPLGRLHPDWGTSYEMRLKALRELIRQMPDGYPIVDRAIEWIALNDEEPTLRQIARRALEILPEWTPN